jgi:hypothetical protein
VNGGGVEGEVLRSALPDPLDSEQKHRDKGKLSVAFDMDSPITEEPSRFDFPIHCEPSIRLRGLTPVGRVRTPPSFLPLIPHRHVVFGHRESTIHGGPHDDNF